MASDSRADATRAHRAALCWPPTGGLSKVAECENLSLLAERRLQSDSNYFWHFEVEMSLALCLKQQRTVWSELGSLYKPWRGLIADWPGFCTAPIKVIRSPGSYPAKPHHTAVHHIIMLFLNILIRYVLFMDSNSARADKDWGYRSQMQKKKEEKIAFHSCFASIYARQIRFFSVR